MDRTLVSGTSNEGSIPSEGTVCYTIDIYLNHMDHSRVIVWALLALVAGAAAGYYFGYTGGYDQAVGYFVAVK